MIVLLPWSVVGVLLMPVAPMVLRHFAENEDVRKAW
tara:strand:- start:7521 stop:7628 length:108 start_codon:yes stop_codon:yes gene_type:complete